jgi:DNA-binding NarL/FixJ family response regulator
MSSDRPIRILIVDDHAVVRKGLVMVLRLNPDFEIVGEAENGRRAVEMALTLQPDLVLLDLIMPEMDGAATAAALRTKTPDVRILILTGIELDEGVIDLLAAGVDGYVPKDIEPEELVEAIRRVAAGESYLHSAVTRHLLEQAAARHTTPLPDIHLTPREREVLELMATPATYKEIAEKLTVGEETIRSHTKRILSKLQQPNRGQAVLAAMRAGLIKLPNGD